ncbi:hypothetical protein MVEG_00934 [Podila verticillata NRRL 6337]|nr:hypothetical protein MVEG_00934 [Podila verticillata NRRL 6337]
MPGSCPYPNSHPRPYSATSFTPMTTATLPLSKKDLVDSSTALSNTMATRDSSQISTLLFHLTSYSFTGAAIMGSSVGLVVYQSRHFNTLGRLQDLSSREHTQPSDLSTPSEASPLYPSSVTGTLLFSSFVSWLPYLVWIMPLFTTSFFIRQRTWIPKQISPRTGMLASQVLFGVVWVLLGSVQEVLEAFVHDTNHRLAMAVAPMDDVNGRGPGSLYAKAGQTSTLDQNSQHNMYSMTPLCIVWYVAIIALGVATGLLTSSSAICEQQLIHEFNDRMAQGQERQISKEQSQFEEAVVVDQDLTEGVEQQIAPTYHRSTRQKILLALWVLTLLWAQLQFFQWVMRSRPADATFDTSSLSSATCMTMFSLFTSVTMLMVGARILPTP